MRTIIWASISILVAAMAVHGLDLSSRPFALQGAPANVEIQPGFAGHDSKSHGGTDPFQGPE